MQVLRTLVPATGRFNRASCGSIRLRDWCRATALGFCALVLSACGDGQVVLPAAAVLTVQPASTSATEGDAATFSVTATGTGLAFQWQRCADNNAICVSWVDVSGAVAATYVTGSTTLAMDGARYRVTVSNAAGSVTSDVVTLTVTAGASTPTTVLSLDFESMLPATVDPGTALLEDVQGFAGLGPMGNQFGGKMLRSATANTVTITLSGLPAHSWLSLEFLFAAIDSLDGTGVFPAGDFLEVKLDGVTVFNESFANTLVTQIQSYVPPVDGELARRVDLGFSGWPDSAYNMAIDSRFQRIPHTASTVTITFRMEGSGEALDNESWGIDNLKVIVGD